MHVSQEMRNRVSSLVQGSTIPFETSRLKIVTNQNPQNENPTGVFHFPLEAEVFGVLGDFLSRERSYHSALFSQARSYHSKIFAIFASSQCAKVSARSSIPITEGIFAISHFLVCLQVELEVTYFAHSRQQYGALLAFGDYRL
jgi:hypothetical protein